MSCFPSILRTAALALGGLALPLPLLHAETVCTVPAGFMSVTTPASTATAFSVPLVRPSVYAGKLAAVAGAVLTVADTPGWAAGEFSLSLPEQPQSYYVRVRSGALEGQWFTIVANTATSLAVDDAGLDLGGLAAGDRIEIAPYWTLGTFFPASKAGTEFFASPSTSVRGTEILCYLPVPGYNNPKTELFYFYAGAWRRAGSPAGQSYDHVVLPPDTFFKIRNKGLPAAEVKTVGTVLAGPFASLLMTSYTTKQDNHVGLPFTGDTTLAGSGLVESGAFAASTSTGSRTDELYVYTGNETGMGTSPSATYYFYNGAWRKVGVSAAVSYDNEPVFRAGCAAILRKGKVAANAPDGVAWMVDTIF